MANTWIWLGSITIEIDKLAHAGYLWASIKNLVDGGVSICWKIYIAHVLIQICLCWRIWVALIISGILYYVNVIYINNLQWISLRVLGALATKYLRYACDIN